MPNANTLDAAHIAQAIMVLTLDSGDFSVSDERWADSALDGALAYNDISAWGLWL